MGNAVGGDFVVVSPVFMGLQKITVLENHAKKSRFYQLLLFDNRCSFQPRKMWL